MNAIVRPLMMAVLVLGGVLAGCRLTDERVAVIRTPDIRNAACADRASRQLLALRGIQRESLKFDLEQGTVTVVYDSMMLGIKNLEHAISDAGFSANELPADPRARAALPPECLGAASNAPPEADAPATAD